MKKLIISLSIFIASLSFSCEAIAQETIQIGDIDMVNLGDGQLFGHNRYDKKTPLKGKVRIITGYTTEYIDGEFSADGLATGKWDYYKNNSLVSSTNYDNGYENGEKITYYNDGKTIESKVFVTKGKADGVYTRYTPDGKKESEKGMKNGIEDGVDRIYDKNEKIISETIYEAGKIKGKSYATYNNGSSDCYTRTSYYKDGLEDGTYEEIFCDGPTKVKGKYINGKKDGTWEYFKKDGSRQKPTEVYENGDLRKRIKYYTNGSVESEESRKDGKQHGSYKTYTMDGKLKSEKNFDEGKQVGDYYQLYSNDTKVKGKYVNGLKEGKWIYYNQSGKITKEEIYEKDVRKSATSFD